MMAEVAHTLPAGIKWHESSTQGFYRPGLQQQRFEGGPFLARDWFGYNLREYMLRPALFAGSGTNLQLWQRWLHDISGGGEVAWIVEPQEETHYDLICGPIADGSKTTFWIPAYGPSSVVVFADGVPQLSGTTTHTVANLAPSDTAASPESGITVATHFSNTSSSGTLAISAGVSRDGPYGLKLTPGGAAADHDVRWHATNTLADVTAGEEYTALASVLAVAAEDYHVDIVWRESDGTLVSTDEGTATTTVAGEWSDLSVTATAPSSASVEKASLRVQRDTSSSNAFYVGCMAICPGDYDRWHLPSQAPGLIEFSTAPSSGARVTATATGERVVRCLVESGSSWTLSAASNAQARDVRMREVPEF